MRSATGGSGIPEALKRMIPPSLLSTQSYEGAFSLKKKNLLKQRQPPAASHMELTSSTDFAPAKRRPISLRYRIALILGLIGVFLYANTLRNGYAVDDGTVISYNSYTTQGVRAIPAIFTSSYRAGDSDPSKKERVTLYRPLSVAMFAAEWQLSPGNPHLGHLVNTILYGLTGFLLFLTLNSLWNLRFSETTQISLDNFHNAGSKNGVRGEKFRSHLRGENPLVGSLPKENLPKSPVFVIPGIITLFFITHPIHTEVAANIKGRDEILSLLFVIAAFKCIASWFNNESRERLLVAGGFFFLAFLSKESAMTCVAVVPLLAWFFDRRFSLRKTIAPTMAAAAGAALYLVIRSIVLHGFMNSSTILPLNNSLVTAPDGISRFATAIMILGRYLLLLLFPYKLSFDYSYQQIPIVGLTDPRALVSLLIIGGILAYAILRFRSKDLIAFAGIFFLVTISIVSNIVFLIESVMGERFLYMPSLGFCIATGILLGRVVPSGDQKTLTSFRKLAAENFFLFVIAVTVAGLYSMRTIVRTFDWKDDVTLSAKDILTCPNSARIQYAYGSYILVEGALKEPDPVQKNRLLDKVIEHLEQAVALYPEFSRAYYHLGVAYKEKGDFGKAVYNFEQARRYNNFEEADFFMAMGLSYAGLKQYDKAIEGFKKAASINPKLTPAYVNIAINCDAMGNYHASIEYLNQALQVDGNSWEACFNMGNTLAHQGRTDEAIEWYEKAIALNRRYADAYNNLGIIYATKKDYHNAYECFKAAVTADPRQLQAQGNLNQVQALLNGTIKSK
jgi:tetratricopeptide (TPR) repeat protein